MNPKYVLAMILVLAPTVNGCVNFQATFVSNSGPGAYPLSAQLWDNRGQSDDPTCSIDNGYADPNDGLFHFTCFQGNYAALFSDASADGLVTYVNPGGTFTFSAPATGLSSPQYAACVYDCGQSGCFVQGAS